MLLDSRLRQQLDRYSQHPQYCICIGAKSNVTTTDGAYIGSCTLEGDPNNTAWIQHCQVPVPLWTTVVVTQDVSTISPDTVPVENPIYFETGDGKTIASHWGVGFQNVPASASAHDVLVGEWIGYRRTAHE